MRLANWTSKNDQRHAHYQRLEGDHDDEDVSDPVGWNPRLEQHVHCHDQH